MTDACEDMVIVVEKPHSVVQVIVAEPGAHIEVQVPGMQGPATIGDATYPVYVGSTPPLSTNLLWLDTSGVE